MVWGSHHGLDVRDYLFHSLKPPFQESWTRAMFVAVFNRKNWFEPVCANFSPNTEVLSLLILIPNFLIFIQPEHLTLYQSSSVKLLTPCVSITASPPTNVPSMTVYAILALLSCSLSAMLSAQAGFSSPSQPSVWPTWPSRESYPFQFFQVLSLTLVVTCLASFLPSQ